MLVRSTLIYAPAIVLTRISALLMLVISTRLINQTEFGLLTLVVTIGELTDSAVTNWLRVSLLRLGGKGDINRGSLILAGRVLIISTTLALLVAAAASHFVAGARWTEFGLAVGAYLVAGAVSRFALTVLQMQQRHTAYSMLEFLRAALQLALPVAATVIAPGSFLAVSLGSSAAVLIAGICAAAVASRRVCDGPSRFTYRELLAFGVPLVVMALVGFGLNSAERLFLNVYYDAAAVAIFAAAYSLARQPVDMIANAVNMGAFPEIVSKFDREGGKAAAAMLSRQLGLTLGLSLPVAGLLIGLSDAICALVLPAQYHGQVEPLFPIIVVSVLFSNVASFVYGNVIHAHKKPWLLVAADGSGSVITVVLSLVLIPPMAAFGAALALAGGTAAGLAACVIISHRLTPVPLPLGSVMASGLIAIVTSGVAAAVSGSLAETMPIVQLALGGGAGSLVFLAGNALAFPSETLSLARRAQARFAGA